MILHNLFSLLLCELAQIGDFPGVSGYHFTRENALTARYERGFFDVCSESVETGHIDAFKLASKLATAYVHSCYSS